MSIDQVRRREMLLDARNGARSRLKYVKHLAKKTNSTMYLEQADSIRKRISIYSQELSDMNKKM